VWVWAYGEREIKKIIAREQEKEREKVRYISKGDVLL
jgi:hypothetical protein